VKGVTPSFQNATVKIAPPPPSPFEPTLPPPPPPSATDTTQPPARGAVYDEDALSAAGATRRAHEALAADDAGDHVPATQRTGAVELAAQKEPVGQAAQVAFDAASEALLKEPPGQGVARADPGAQKKPRAHGVAAVEPGGQK
jgi:hypothetical protein